MFVTPSEDASSRAWPSGSETYSIPVTWPLCAREAKSMVIDPGPQPISRILEVDVMYGMR